MVIVVVIVVVVMVLVFVLFGGRTSMSVNILARENK